MGGLVEAVAIGLDVILDIYVYILLAAAVASWVNVNPFNPVVRFLYTASEPVFRRIRRFVPLFRGVDISPAIAIFGILIIKKFLVASLLGMARSLG
jgi:YggT family protein